MPTNVFGISSSSNNNGKKIDTSKFVEKPYLRTNYINIREAASKNFVDDLFNDPSVIKSTSFIDLNDRNITNARF